MNARALAIAGVALGCIGCVGASAQSLRLEVDTEEIHAGLPFVLSLSASGFEESPEPAAPELAIEDCTVTYLGMSPSVSRQIQIVNGER